MRTPICALSAALLLSAADPDTPDERGVTPLVRAAALMPEAAVRALIDQGANVNRPSAGGVTPLMAAVGDIAKVRLLVEKGADVNAASARGLLPVTLAARLSGGSGVVTFLLSKGAKPTAGAVRSAMVRGDTALVRRLLAAGAPLEAAMISSGVNSVEPELVRIVLEKFPAAARSGGQQQALRLSSFHGPVETVRMLLAAGADVHATDNRGRTALMYAVAGDRPSAETVRLLLTHGADPNAKDVREETALDLARYRGRRDVIEALGGVATAKPAPRTAAGAPPPLKEALERAVALLDAAGPAFFKANGCISCHNQSIPQMAAAAVREHGLVTSDKAASEQTRAVLATWGPHRDALWQNDCTVIPGAVATMSYGLIGLAASRQPRSDLIDLVSACLARLQYDDGHWWTRDARHPLGASPAKYTALTIRALKSYTPSGLRAEYAGRIRRAVEYLETAAEDDPQGLSFRILGLTWAGTNSPLRQRLAAELKKHQFDGGGWAQQPEMSPDAYATGQALWALSEGLDAGAADPAFARGAAWLRSNQRADGSWHVKSRGNNFQPYRETGFPHGHDQWISSAATGFAVLGLAPLLQR